MIVGTKAEFERLADFILRDYLGNAYDGYDPLDIQAFAKDYLKLDISYFAFDPDTGIEGMRTGNQIILDDRLLDDKKAGERNFTIAHECGHDLINWQDPSYSPQTVVNYRIKSSGKSLVTEDDFKEWQANVVASCLLLRPNLVGWSMFTFMRKDKVTVFDEHYLYPEDRYRLRMMACYLGVSRVPKCVNAEQKNTLLSGAIHCGVCGKICRIVNRKDTVQWACRTHQNDASTCPTMPVPEAEIIRAFTNMYNKLKTNKKVIITPIINQLVTLKNRISAQSLEYAEIDRQIMLINDQLALIADLKQKQMIDEETYHRKSNELNNSMGSLRSKRRQFLNNSQADQAISEIKRLASLIDKGPDKIEELDEDLLDTLIEDINIDTSDEIKFKLVGGLVLKEHIERTHR